MDGFLLRGFAGDFMAGICSWSMEDVQMVQTQRYND